MITGAALKVRVWDPPTRIVHWLLVVLVAISWWTAENGQLEWHRYSGYTLLGVLVFRVYWAFAGSRTARLFSYLRGPRSALAHARNLIRRDDPNQPHPPGHNPLGAWSALTLLTLLLTQVTLGLFAVDIDGIESGPLSHLVSFETGRDCAQWHETVFNVLLVFIALHIVTVFFYLLYKRNNLIAPMITGSRSGAAQLPQSLVQKGSIAGRAILGVALASAVVWSIVRGLWL